jgi:hypothetical protein
LPQTKSDESEFCLAGEPVGATLSTPTGRESISPTKVGRGNENYFFVSPCPHSSSEAGGKKRLFYR